MAQIFLDWVRGLSALKNILEHLSPSVAQVAWSRCWAILALASSSSLMMPIKCWTFVCVIISVGLSSSVLRRERSCVVLSSCCAFLHLFSQMLHCCTILVALFVQCLKILRLGLPCISSAIVVQSIWMYSWSVIFERWEACIRNGPRCVGSQCWRISWIGRWSLSSDEGTTSMCETGNSIIKLMDI